MRHFEKGFTLLELIIAITILAVLSTYTAIGISDAMKRRGKVEKEIESSTLIRDALRIIERDINKAFNYQDFHVQLFNEAQAERKNRYDEKKGTKNKTNPTDTADQQNQDQQNQEQEQQQNTDTVDGSTDSGPGKEFKTKKPREDSSFFVGEANNLNFTSLSNVQTTAKEMLSRMAEVGYYIETCKGRLDKQKTSKCLWRRTSRYIDDQPEEGGSATVLLEDVETFQLRYYNTKTEDWVSNWDSLKSQNPDIKAHFPAAVEVKLIVVTSRTKDQKNKDETKEYGFNLVAPIRFVNNPRPVRKPTQNAPDNSGSTDGTGSGDQTGDSGDGDGGDSGG